MESAVPREVVNACGGFEERDRCTRGLWLLMGNAPRHTRDLQIIEPAEEAAFEALSEKIFYHQGNYLL